MMKSVIVKELLCESDILKELDFLGHKLFWLQAFRPTNKGRVGKQFLYTEFCAKDRVIELCKKYNGQGIICVAINERPKDKQGKEDVKKVTTIFIDVDIPKDRKVDFVSTPEDHAHALTTGQNIKTFLEGQGFVVGLIKDSGNGCQLFLKVNIEIATDQTRSNFTNRLKMFYEKLKCFNDDIVNIDDSAKDINKRVKLAGTLNVKDNYQAETRLSKLIYVAENQGIETNTQAFEKLLIESPNTQQKTAPSIVAVEQMPFPEVEKIIKQNSKLNSLVFVDGLISGKTTKYKTVSEAEFGLLAMLFNAGVRDFDSINSVMCSIVSGSTWKNKPDHYRQLTFKKASLSFEKRKEYFPSKSIPSDNEFFGIKNFNKSTPVIINSKSKIYDHLIENTHNGVLNCETIFSLWSGNVGAGNKPVIIKTDSKLILGDNDLYLKTMPREEVLTMLFNTKQKAILALCKLLSVKDKIGDVQREKEELICDLADSMRFVELILPINKEDIISLGPPYAVISSILKNGLEKDWLIDYLSLAVIPEVNQQKIAPDHYMRYSPNQILITNSKTGKSFNSLIVTGEPSLERPTEAGLLGFASADRQTHGILHGRVKHTFVEEIQEEKGEELFGKCHTYMENGQTQIARGMRVNVKGCSGITFQGNPKIDSSQINADTSGNLLDFLTIKEFQQLLTKISTNAEPFASRIGVTVFNTKLKTVEGKPHNNDPNKHAHKIIQTYAQAWRDEFTALFFNEAVLTWLNASFDEEYKRVVKVVVEGCADKITQRYLTGQLNSWRHTKGIALRLAWLEVGLCSLWSAGSTDIDELLANAEDHFSQLKKINLASFQNIVCLTESESDQLLKYKINAIAPEFLKLGLFSLFEWSLANLNSKDDMIPLSALEPYFSFVKEKLSIDVNGGYRSFARVSKLVQGFQGSYDSVFDPFFVKFDKSDSAFIILKRGDLDKCAQAYLKGFAPEKKGSDNNVKDSFKTAVNYSGNCQHSTGCTNETQKRLHPTQNKVYCKFHWPLES